MTDSASTPQNETNDPSTEPGFEQLGEEGNAFSGSDSDAGIDRVPSGGDDGSAGDQNPPLPDWGPTDGEHGVDGADPEK